MKLYSDYPSRRGWQITGDIVSVLAVLAFIALGIIVYLAIAAFEPIGQAINDGGSNLAASMSDLGDRLGGIPFIGPSVSEPFLAAMRGGQAISDAGMWLSETILYAAVFLGLLVSIPPVLGIVAAWFLSRFRFARRAGRIASIVRAKGTLELEDLIALELRRAGIRSPTAGGASVR